MGMALRPAVLVALLAVAGASAAVSRSTAQTAPAPRRDAPVPFRVGETLTYDVTYSSYLVAGTAVTTVQDRRSTPGATSYYIVVEGRPVPMLASLYRLYYKMDTLLDSVTLLPHRGSMHAEEGGRRRTALTRFDRATRKGVFEVQTEPAGRLEFDIPPQVQDGLSGLFVLRSMTLRPGDSITLPVADEGLVYNVRASATGTERLRVPLGEFDASVLKMTITDPAGQPAATNTAVWFSNDARRLPLKMQADLPVGSFVLLLRQATP
jgi:hypothetical protein